MAATSTALLVSSWLSDSLWPRHATALPSVFKLSMLLVDSSSLLGRPGIGSALTSCQSAGETRRRGLGLRGEGEDKTSNEEGRRVSWQLLDWPDMQVRTHTQIFFRFPTPSALLSHVSTTWVKGQSVHLLNYYFLFTSNDFMYTI